VQAADAVDGAAAAHGQVGYVERLVGVVWMDTAQRQQLLHADAQVILGVEPQRLFDEGRRKPIEPRLDGRVGGEEVAGARDREGDVERHAVVLHEAPRPFQHGEGRVPFVEVTDLGLPPEGAQQAPAADAEHDLLEQAQLRAAAVELAGDAPQGRRIGGVVGVEQVEGGTANLHLPGADPGLIAGQGHLQAHPLAVWIAHRRDG
jgi:hypothetical protein